MTQPKSGNEGAFADQSAEGQSDLSEGDRNPDQGSEPLGGDDGDKGSETPTRQGPVADRK